MLHCKQCKMVKPDDCFYESNQTRCKECVKEAVRANRQEKIEYYRAYDRERGCRQDATYLREYRARNATKARAHRKVSYEMRAGRLTRQTCQQCGSSPTHAHHDDYTKPLEVRWLCAACHRQWHIENGEAKTA